MTCRYRKTHQKRLILRRKPSPSSPITLVDAITFTTTISAGVTPKISFSPVGHQRQLMDAFLTSTNMRVDKHEVVVGLAVACPPASQGRLRGLTTTPYLPDIAFPTIPTLIMPPFPPLTSGPTAICTQQLAATAVNQQIVRFELLKVVMVAS
jgi:hypothetical protein